MFRPDCKASRVIFRTGSKKQPPMKGSPAIGTRLLNGLELKHQSRFGLDCLNDHSIAEDLSRLLVERTSHNGAPGVTRTPGPRFRKPLLYPPELQAHGFILNDAEAILEMKRGTEVMPLLWVYCSTKKTPFSPQSFHDPAAYHY